MYVCICVRLAMPALGGPLTCQRISFSEPHPNNSQMCIRTVYVYDEYEKARILFFLKKYCAIYLSN